MLQMHSHLFDDESVSRLTLVYAPGDVFGSRDIGVDFQPETDEEKIAFSNRLIYNLNLLKLPGRCDSVTTRRELLRKYLQALGRKKTMTTALQDYNFEAAMILIEQAIPCMLHMENRVGERI